jgi:hypothetical protein
MPQKAKTAKPEAKATEPETKPVEAAPEAPKGTKTQAIKAALKANPKKGPKGIADLLQAQGLDVTPAYVSTIKTNLKAKKRKKVAVPAAAPEPAPAVPKDAVSLGLLQKAKKLAAQLGGIKEAKAAIDALSQLMD